MTKLCLLPNQLFDESIINNFEEIVLWEHPDFFTIYNFNKKKLILHRSSMKYYFDNVLKKLNILVRYIEFSEKFNSKEYIFFDPINRIKNIHIQLESPNFFLTKLDYENIYTNKKSKRINFTNYFYPRCKHIVQFLENTKSTDKNNRKSYNNKLTFHEKPNVSNKYVEEAIKYVNKHFKNNCGNVDHFDYPIHRNDALKWLDFFIQKHLKDFGSYQDAFNKKHHNMYHSMLSSSINIGILNPQDILEKLKKVKNIPINSLEGYFRQLCWREYQRYCYIYYYDLKHQNYLMLNKNINKKWYKGGLHIEPIDNCIKKAFDTAYLHHIERLMIMGNSMVLFELKPDHIFKWFMEFAIDSYEWLMIQNVYDMVCYTSKGMTSYKPYISTSNYIVNLSDYSEDEEWTNKWDKKYRSFVDKKYDLLKDTPFRIYL